MIIETGLGAWPCDEVEYSTCASSDRGWVRLCISDIIWIKGLKAQVLTGRLLMGKQNLWLSFYVRIRRSDATAFRS